MKNNLDKHIAAYEGRNLYDFDNNIQLNWYPHRILKRCKNARSILELGLGPGITTTIFSKHFKRHVVLDASPAVIERFRLSHPDCSAHIVESYFEDFQSDERFDVIVMGFVLEHVDDPHKILTHFRQFLAPKGKMFLTVPNAEVLNRKLGHLAGMLPDMKQLSEHDYLCGHQRYFTVQSLKEAVVKAGYKIRRIEGIYLKPFTTTQMKSLNFPKNVMDALCEVGIDYPELCCGMLVQLC